MSRLELNVTAPTQAHWMECERDDGIDALAEGENS